MSNKYRSCKFWLTLFIFILLWLPHLICPCSHFPSHALCVRALQGCMWGSEQSLQADSLLTAEMYLVSVSHLVWDRNIPQCDKVRRAVTKTKATWRQQCKVAALSLRLSTVSRGVCNEELCWAGFHMPTMSLVLCTLSFKAKVEH